MTGTERAHGAEAWVIPQATPVGPMPQGLLTFTAPARATGLEASRRQELRSGDEHGL
ncbi:hypothetical protein AB0M95_22610 [Sphaerisporangium sp. NPDC051017]|uniref:hypothetical protein n=1 Tax=Sphaerisporangium sp. NPDC051017 TaxID=3154636 RepID=UPI0034356D6A